MRFVIIIGPPGSGKGTQCERLSTHYGLKHLSTGALFRRHMAQKTPLGQQIQHFVNEGNLVPDEVVVRVVIEAFEHFGPNTKGFLLDGFPRTQAQAERLRHYLNGQQQTLHSVLFLDVPTDVLKERLKSRGTMENRSDDQDEEKIEHRLNVYQKQTQPLLDYYKKQGELYTLPGARSVEEVFRVSKHILDRDE